MNIFTALSNSPLWLKQLICGIGQCMAQVHSCIGIQNCNGWKDLVPRKRAVCRNHHTLYWVIFLSLVPPAEVMFCRRDTLQGAIKAETNSGQILYCSPIAQTDEIGADTADVRLLSFPSTIPVWPTTLHKTLLCCHSSNYIVRTKEDKGGVGLEGLTNQLNNFQIQTLFLVLKKESVKMYKELSPSFQVLHKL